MAESVAPGWGFGRREMTLALLAFASASSDVLSFLILDQVFTSAMTGNTALLGLALGQRQGPAAAHAAAALLGFALGVVAGALAAGESRDARALAAVLGLEALCLGLFVALWCATARPVADGLVYPLILLSALGMGLQIVAARQVNLPGIPTVVFTSTLAAIITTAVAAARRRQPLSFDAWRQSAVFSTYLAGAMLAGALAPRHPGLLVPLPFAAVLGALALQFPALPSESG